MSSLLEVKKKDGFGLQESSLGRIEPWATRRAEGRMGAGESHDFVSGAGHRFGSTKRTKLLCISPSS